MMHRLVACQSRLQVRTYMLVSYLIFSHHSRPSFFPTPPSAAVGSYVRPLHAHVSVCRAHFQKYMDPKVRSSLLATPVTDV